MTPARRFLVVGLAVAAGETALGLAALPSVIGVYLLVCAVASAAFAAGTHRLLVPPSDDADGGVGPSPDDGPEPPPWWPDFEEAFRAHVHERSHERLRV